ncbi:hypothetical protein HY992_02690 [Candidatus Micrarchaeota archaeon]|nr:hypothetical protein [Candidatus Micrarchaeota archaeon]
MSLRSEAAKVAAKLFEGIMKALGRASKEEAKAAAQLARRQAAGTGRIWRYVFSCVGAPTCGF